MSDPTTPELTAEQLLEAVKAGVDIPIPQTPGEEKPAEEAPPAKEEPKKVYNCPRCTHRLLNADGSVPEKIKPEEAEVQEYVRRIMSAQRFEKTYSIHNSMGKITFTTLDTRQAKHLHSVLRQLTLEDSEQASLRETSYSLRMMCAIKKIESPGKAREFTFPDDGDTLEYLKKEYDDRFGEEDEWMMVILIRAFSEFERLLGLLAEASFNENFWEGAGLE